MTYAELKEAIGRWRNVEASGIDYSEIYGRGKRESDCGLITSMILSREPITAEGLKACGFDESAGRYVWKFGESGRVYAQQSIDCFYLSYTTRVSKAHERFKPQPKTMGQLTSLLLQLDEG